MRWQIETLIGLGPLKLGMSRAEVGAALDPLGHVTAFFDAFSSGKKGHRGLRLPVVIYDDGIATGFDTDWRVKDVYIDEFEIYGDPSQQVLQFLEHKNGGGVLAGVGSALFNRLGINTGSFYFEQEGTFFEVGSDERDDERGLSVFRKGAFDALLGSFHPITFEPG